MSIALDAATVSVSHPSCRGVQNDGLARDSVPAANGAASNGGGGVAPRVVNSIVRSSSSNIVSPSFTARHAQHSLADAAKRVRVGSVRLSAHLSADNSAAGNSSSQQPGTAASSSSPPSPAFIDAAESKRAPLENPSKAHGASQSGMQGPVLASTSSLRVAGRPETVHCVDCGEYIEIEKTLTALGSKAPESAAASPDSAFSSATAAAVAALREHARTHCASRRVGCPGCGAVFALQDLCEHIMSVCEAERFRCTGCQTVFYTAFEFASHGIPSCVAPGKGTGTDHRARASSSQRRRSSSGGSRASQISRIYPVSRLNGVSALHEDALGLPRGCPSDAAAMSPVSRPLGTKCQLCGQRVKDLEMASHCFTCPMLPANHSRDSRGQHQSGYIISSLNDMDDDTMFRVCSAAKGGVDDDHCRADRGAGTARRPDDIRGDGACASPTASPGKTLQKQEAHFRAPSKFMRPPKVLYTSGGGASVTASAAPGGWKGAQLQCVSPAHPSSSLSTPQANVSQRSAGHEKSAPLPGEAQDRVNLRTARAGAPSSSKSADRRHASPSSEANPAASAERIFRKSTEQFLRDVERDTSRAKQPTTSRQGTPERRPSPVIQPAMLRNPDQVRWKAMYASAFSSGISSKQRGYAKQDRTPSNNGQSDPRKVSPAPPLVKTVAAKVSAESEGSSPLRPKRQAKTAAPKLVVDAGEHDSPPLQTVSVVTPPTKPLARNVAPHSEQFQAAPTCGIVPDSSCAIPGEQCLDGHFSCPEGSLAPLSVPRSIAGCGSDAAENVVSCENIVGNANGHVTPPQRAPSAHLDIAPVARRTPAVQPTSHDALPKELERGADITKSDLPEADGACATAVSEAPELRPILPAQQPIRRMATGAPVVSARVKSPLKRHDSTKKTPRQQQLTRTATPNGMAGAGTNPTTPGRSKVVAGAGANSPSSNATSTVPHQRSTTGPRKEMATTPLKLHSSARTGPAAYSRGGSRYTSRSGSAVAAVRPSARDPTEAQSLETSGVFSNASVSLSSARNNIRPLLKTKKKRRSSQKPVQRPEGPVSSQRAGTGSTRRRLSPTPVGKRCVTPTQSQSYHRGVSSTKPLTSRGPVSRPVCSATASTQIRGEGTAQRSRTPVRSGTPAVGDGERGAAGNQSARSRRTTSRRPLTLDEVKLHRHFRGMTTTAAADPGATGQESNGDEDGDTVAVADTNHALQRGRPTLRRIPIPSQSNSMDPSEQDEMVSMEGSKQTQRHHQHTDPVSASIDYDALISVGGRFDDDLDVRRAGRVRAAPKSSRQWAAEVFGLDYMRELDDDHGSGGGANGASGGGGEDVGTTVTRRRPMGLDSESRHRTGHDDDDDEDVQSLLRHAR